MFTCYFYFFAPFFLGTYFLPLNTNLITVIFSLLTILPDMEVTADQCNLNRFLFFIHHNKHKKHINYNNCVI